MTRKPIMGRRKSPAPQYLSNAKLVPTLVPVVAGACLLASTGTAWGFEFNSGSDWTVRWDNTVKYNLMFRAAEQNDKIVASPERITLVTDDADLNFDRGSIVSNRLDLLTEFDVVWRDTLGFRISAAGWYDHAYSGSSDYPSSGLNENLGVNTWGALSVEPGEYTDTTKKYHYFGGELLDAFLFASFDTEAISGNFRLGRHTLFWGNSLFGVGAVHGIAGSMVALDINKALSVPGSDSQELFLPTSRFSTVLQLSNDLTFNAYWSLEYQEYRQAQTGAYFSTGELVTEDSEYLVLAGAAPGGARTGQVKADNETPDGTSEWGINLQYYIAPASLDIGFVYLRYNDKLNSGSIGYLGALQPISPDANGLGEFKWVYKDNIDLYGLTLNKQIGGMSMGLDFVHRRNTALPSELGASLQQTAEIFTAADSGNYSGPVGHTWHAIFNGVLLLGPSALWEGGTFAFEVTASWLDEVTDNEALVSTKLSKGRVATAGQVLFRPQWFQVFSGTDLSMPMSVSYAFDGDAPIVQGGNAGLGNASIGLEFLVKQTWAFGAKYNAFFGPVDAGAAGLINDRDNVALTVKRTF